jgi:hypothetical protein
MRPVLKGDDLTTFTVPKVEKIRSLNLPEPQGRLRPVAGKLYLLLFHSANGFMNAPQCYVTCISSLPVLFKVLLASFIWLREAAISASTVFLWGGGVLTCVVTLVRLRRTILTKTKRSWTIILSWCTQFVELRYPHYLTVRLQTHALSNKLLLLIFP